MIKTSLAFHSFKTPAAVVFETTCCCLAHWLYSVQTYRERGRVLSLFWVFHKGPWTGRKLPNYFDHSGPIEISFRNSKTGAWSWENHQVSKNHFFHPSRVHLSSSSYSWIVLDRVSFTCKIWCHSIQPADTVHHQWLLNVLCKLLWTTLRML